MSKTEHFSSITPPKRFPLVLKRLLQLYLIYCIVGLLIPPLFQKEAEVVANPGPQPWGEERVLCVDGNEEALLWRLRLIESAQQEIILATFDWREDNSGRDIMAAMQGAADRGAISVFW